MKSLLILTVILSLVACTKPSGSSKDPSGNPIPVKTQGGVDVGNLTTAIVPRTNASLSYPNSWKGEEPHEKLVLANGSGSVIVAQKSEIKEIASPNSLSVQQYLKSKYPDREYKILQLNGLEGVRADLINTVDQKKSDIYLISELKDFIHIESDLRKSEDGIAAGEKIIATVRVKYQGVPVENAQSKTITLEKRKFNNEPDRHAYSLQNDCFVYSNTNCQGVAVAYENDFTIGTAGYDHGRVVELGPESQIPFESIRVEGEYLVAPLSNILISDVYTAFTPKDPKKDQDQIQLKKGYVYLIRTISWPEEDLITKMRVDDIEESKSVKITFQKLVYVRKDELKKQVDLINKSTIENEQPLDSGEVTLYNRSVWSNYFFASFNFQYSTSGNMFITHNNWDLLFQNGGYGKPGFVVPHTGVGLGEVIDLGEKAIESVSLADFPDPNQYKSGWGPDVIVGHTYAIYHFDYDDDSIATYGAVTVLEMDSEGRWVRLKFRRIQLGKVPHFQKWIGLSVPQGIQRMELQKSDDYKASAFHPFINQRGDQGRHYYETMRFESFQDGYDILGVDTRPYGKSRGFYLLPAGTSLDQVTTNDVESLKGQFVGEIDFKKGETYAVLLENLYDKTILVMKIEDSVPGKSVTFSYKYLLRAKTQYSDDKE